MELFKKQFEIIKLSFQFTFENPLFVLLSIFVLNSSGIANVFLRKDSDAIIKGLVYLFMFLMIYLSAGVYKTLWIIKIGEQFNFAYFKRYANKYFVPYVLVMTFLGLTLFLLVLLCSLIYSVFLNLSVTNAIKQLPFKLLISSLFMLFTIYCVPSLFVKEGNIKNVDSIIYGIKFIRKYFKESILLLILELVYIGISVIIKNPIFKIIVSGYLGIIIFITAAQIIDLLDKNNSES